MKFYYTDGACKGNPGPGGFGVYCPDTDYTYSEYCDNTTNNREEMKAIIHVFEKEKESTENIIILSDSAYCVNMLDSWIYNWAKNGWINSKKKEVENIDLVKTLYKYISTEFFPCQVVKIAGHSGCIGNEIADALATGDMKKLNKYKEIADERSNYSCS